MATKLSVNINKIALLRNSRGRDYPSVNAFARQCLELGAAGITLHPRPDQRHARYSDCDALKPLCDEFGAELNIEGYPTRDFLDTVIKVKPAQCTLVPDEPGQLTSDHGWNIRAHSGFLREVVGELKANGVRSSLFVDHDYADYADAVAVGAERVELYTEAYAHSWGTAGNERLWQAFAAAAARAQALRLGVNAGHDLNLDNLGRFLQIPGILEVSIGHALVVECLQYGLAETMARYARIVG